MKKFKGNELISSDSIVAVANESKQENSWFIQHVNSNCILEKIEADSCGNTIIAGVRVSKGHFLEKLHEQKDHILNKI